jgi:predicted PurR-regulated permease PerM
MSSSAPALLEAKRRGAAALVVGLGIALLIALTPYATGLIAIPVFYVALAPAHTWLARRVGPKGAASLVVALTLLLLVVLGGSFAGLIVNEAQRIATNVTQSPILGRLSELRLGGVDVGARLADLGAKVVSWIGSSAFGFIGSASRFALNLTISFFGVFYLLLRPQETWDAVRPYIPFSARNTEKLRQDFRDVTTSTLLGTGLSAAIHGVLVSLAFWVAGLPNAALWGVVTMVFSILPVLGSGMVWGPGAIVLLLEHRPGPAVLLALWGLVVVGNVDYVIRPMVARRFAHIHPLVTLLGALIGVPYFGILGLLVGPLALSYFFELIDMYREEYLSTA